MNDAQVACEEALKADADVADVTLLRGRPRSFVNASAIRLIVTITCAVIALFAAALREEASTYAIDALALLLRVVAFGFIVRAAVLAKNVVSNVQLALRARRYRLAIHPEGLLLQDPRGRRFVARDDVVAIVMPDVSATSARSTHHAISIVLAPNHGGTHVTLPDAFAESSTQIAERLMRWQGEHASNAASATLEDAQAMLQSEVYDRASRGDDLENVTPIHIGSKWARRGPYTSLLLGIALLFSFARASSNGIASSNLLAFLSALLVAVPVIWLLITRRALAPRKGLVFVLTPTHMLLRTRQGVSGIPLADVRRARIDAVASWSLVEGYVRAAQLVIEQRDGNELHMDGDLLREPVEVALALCKYYRATAQ